MFSIGVSDNTKAEVHNYVTKKLANASKRDLCYVSRDALEDLLKECGFVFIADNGSVIHSRRFCGNAYGDPVPFETAYKKGFRKLCSKCTPGTYVETLLLKHEVPYETI